jgi:hypothetical protein
MSKIPFVRCLDTVDGLSLHKLSKKLILTDGLRVCPGKHMGYSSVWFNIASVLSVFRIEKAVDEMGKPIEPELEYSYGGIWSVPYFIC